MKKFLTILFCLLIAGNCYAQGCDSNTRFLAHFDETDGSTTMAEENCDESGARTLTASGDAQTDSGKQKFDNTLLCDGNGDYVTTDAFSGANFFNNSTSEKVIDLWVNLNDTVSDNKQFMSASTSSAARWNMQYSPSGTNDYIRILARGGTFLTWTSGSVSSLEDSNWHHIAAVKNGSIYAWYFDGNQSSYLSSTNVNSLTNPIMRLCARSDSAGDYFNGNLDEVRIQDSDYFEANPVSGLTDTITVPTVAYSVADSGRGRLILITKFIKRNDGRGYDRIQYTQNFGWKGLEL